MKILLNVRMRTAAIALNYNVENIRNDVRQKIIIYENSQFDSLVWGSLTLAPITSECLRITEEWFKCYDHDK